MITVRKFALACAAVAVALLAGAAQAAPMYHFDYTCAGCAIPGISFDLAASPTVSSSDATTFTITNVSTAPGPVSADLTFLDASELGGFQAFDPLSNAFLANATGDQLFTGPLSSPTFILKTFATVDSSCDLGCASSLTISAAGVAVPEPATASLFGLALAGFAVARRKPKLAGRRRARA